MEKTFVLHTPEDTDRLAEALCPHLRKGDVVALEGGLGAGKTCLASCIGRRLGVADPIVSPTYMILCEYDGRDYTVYHYDLYRLNQAEEILGTGFFDFMDEGVSLIEWPELVEPYLPERTFRVRFTVEGETRHVRVTYPDSCAP